MKLSEIAHLSVRERTPFGRWSRIYFAHVAHDGFLVVHGARDSKGAFKAVTFPLSLDDLEADDWEFIPDACLRLFGGDWARWCEGCLDRYKRK